MDAFEQTFGAVFALCLGVMVLTLFFKGVACLGGLFDKSDKTVIKSQSFIAADTLVKVHLDRGHIIDRVTFLGFALTTVKGQTHGQGLPFELARMAVFKKGDGAKIYVPARAISSIEELPTQPS
jgi:hypothetical protein